MHQHKSSTGKMELRISAAGCTDTGRVREQNEDTIALCEPPDKTLVAQLGQLYLLADGAGGDGHWSKLTEEQIATVVSQNTAQAACAQLVHLANAAGGEDNISAIVLSFHR